MPARLIRRLRNGVVAFPLAALTALAMFFISETSYQDARASLDELGARSEARSNIQLLSRSLLEAETAQRGFLLTGRDDYLEPYRTALPMIERSLAWLRSYYANDGDDRAVGERVIKLSGEKLSEIETTLKLQAAGRESAWRELLLTDIGREKMQSVQALTKQLLDVEAARIRTSRDSVFRTLLLNRIGVTAMTALSLLALFMYLRQSAALDRERTEQEEVIQNERDRLEAEVTARTIQLKELAQHLQTVREDERSRLARELHDELGALLTAAKLDAARLKSRLGATTPEVAERLTHLNEALNGGIALKRRIIEDLRPSSLSNLGLVAALDILTREFGARSDIEMVCDLHPVHLDAPAELTIYRLIQEALTNVAKYAKASRVEIRLGPDANGNVHVSVRDDGVGFDPRTRRTSTHGLVGMRYRVEAEGGEMKLTSAPGQGTLIEAVLPQAIPAKEPREGVDAVPA
ncbi:CHASE3 domain-containing protein [Piscinibacter koreensis]|uniref:histidine kinase n=1 Tax=Piscinibacter koreensis TaxID=2742824 RepID=A0A7Y6TVJ6_9BURK|nr:CHASE3 domain-containing protein [Schlegelella koreensis]NUZ05073.1 CHASE3 domain-containing protein [Schlegelella koreensis]